MENEIEDINDESMKDDIENEKIIKMIDEKSEKFIQVHGNNF